MSFIRLIVLLTLIPLVGWSETVSGRMVDSETGDRLPYVNIGVLGGERGTVSNDQGYFHFDLTDLMSETTIRFSYIGYENHDASITDLRLLGENLGEIKLTPKTLEMQSVLVYPREFKEKVVGNPHAPPMMRAGFKKDSLGYEVGIRVKIKRHPTLLKTLTLHGVTTTYDTVFYRLNVYEMEDKLPGKNILKQPIYITLTDFEQGADITLDLTSHHIVVHDDFVITLEYVKEMGEGELQFSTGILNGKIFYRKTSQALWKGAPFGLGMSVRIRYEK
ncbi:MAG: hypothetical protein HN995_06180 [Candidatus Marinimicrobia bacterium]|jgi:hypothetical protein|nr:hypothetical protein [Candidatus Neomarinimicrobiota bacterium]MBT3679351.1 hypothetical protein [Candidatus Neomarinimicrobiota bacterium]MBT3951180.1 hypothetical protein [Candidatus Neomarinimicrobiota bacterium]MBT4254140.1 hypothetical protein [Candidatus Neomarinimicrobiota bacterium]MBT4479978.1 hypothetical protein [Candidatus Neomarinimicrobiota bacterium]